MQSINPMKLLQAKAALDRFKAEHPKLPLFFQAVRESAIEPGTVVEINVTTAQGRRLSTNLKLSESDIELIREMKEMAE